MKRMIVLLLITASLALLGSGCATSRIAGEETIRVRLDATASITVQGKGATLADLGQAFEELGVKPNSPVLIVAAKTVEYKHIVAVLDELKKLGQSNISMVTEKWSPTEK